MFLTLRTPIAVAVIAAVAALSGETAGIVASVANGALLVLIVADVLAAPSPSKLAPQRIVDPVATIGREIAVSLRVRNPRSRELRVSVHDATPPSFRRTPVRHRAIIPPSRSALLEASARPERRGPMTLGPVTLRTGGPLGLAGRQRTIPLREPVKVYPALPGRAEAELRLSRARLLQSGERSTAIRGGGTEFDSLRDYHPDDEFRRINWLATARAGRPITNVYREERNQQVLLLLDASRMTAGTVGGVSRFEHAVDAAMTVAELAARVGDHAGMLAFGSHVRSAMPPRGGRAQSRRILDSVYALQPQLEAPNYRLAFSTVMTRWRRRSMILLLTELAEESALDALFAAVPILLSRHLLVVGSVLDPAVESLALSDPVTAADAYDKAAALDALASREHAAARLRSLGAIVVDRPPGALSGAVADAYLRIKATGRL